MNTHKKKCIEFFLQLFPRFNIVLFMESNVSRREISKSPSVRVLTLILQLSTYLNIYKSPRFRIFHESRQRCFEILFVRSRFVVSGVEYFKLEQRSENDFIKSFRVHTHKIYKSSVPEARTFEVRPRNRTCVSKFKLFIFSQTNINE